MDAAYEAAQHPPVQDRAAQNDYTTHVIMNINLKLAGYRFNQ
jgi:hypothetical protein